jgi:hypothetical protein
VQEENNEKQLPTLGKKNNPYLPFFFAFALAAGIAIGYFFTFRNSPESASGFHSKSNSRFNSIAIFVPLQ